MSLRISRFLIVWDRTWGYPRNLLFQSHLQHKLEVFWNPYTTYTLELDSAHNEMFSSFSLTGSSNPIHRRLISGEDEEYLRSTDQWNTESNEWVSYLNRYEMVTPLYAHFIRYFAFYNTFS